MMSQALTGTAAVRANMIVGMVTPDGVKSAVRGVGFGHREDGIDQSGEPGAEFIES